MSRFNNSYLAESVGYNNGHANGMADGVAVGRKHGYTQGWNEATIHANNVIAERDQEIDRLSNEIHKGNAFIKELRAALEKSQRVSDLYHFERDQLCIEAALTEEKSPVAARAGTSHARSEYEGMLKAFQGTAAIAVRR